VHKSKIKDYDESNAKLRDWLLSLTGMKLKVWEVIMGVIKSNWKNKD
jgi:hypothetical protein